MLEMDRLIRPLVITFIKYLSFMVIWIYETKVKIHAMHDFWSNLMLMLIQVSTCVFKC